MSASSRRFERRVKKIVKHDVESQTGVEDGQQFFIDKEVYDKYLPDMKENMEDSSLSDFLLKYELGIHTTELIQYFGPPSSKKRDFVNLKHLSGKYGYHLCYMALRESASDANDNKELVARMKSKAISLKKVPPTDMLVDSPCSSDEDVPRGQGEDPVSDIDQIKQTLDGFTIKDIKNGEEKVKNISEEEADHERHRNFSQTHSNLCNCGTCQWVKRKTLSDPPSNDYKRSQSEYPRVVTEEEGHNRVRPFSSPQQVSSAGGYNTSTNISGDNVEQVSTDESEKASMDYYSTTKQSPLSVGKSKVVSGHIDGHDDTISSPSLLNES